MKVGVMQPYLFPYLAYFQLIGAVDRFVIYDDVNYIQRGWINRNWILGPQGPQRITLQLSGASQNKLINAIAVGTNRPKLLMTIHQSYSRARNFSSVFPLIEECLTSTHTNLSHLLEFSLRKVCSYLGIETEILLSSSLQKNNSLRGENKIITISRDLGADTYINAIGGQALYDRARFREAGLELLFLKMNEIVYQQGRAAFVPNLSIIDVMMHVPGEKIPGLLREYTLV